MPARSKRSKANQKISRKKYRVDPEVDVEEPELNKALDNHDFAEDETQADMMGQNQKGSDKSLKRTIYAGGSERTQRRWRANLKST
ncbi:hypothetical protein V1505DRAFT_369107, partial [Lipomyces doorenjongii]